MTFDALLHYLPNGLHDATLRTLRVDYGKALAQLDVMRHTGNANSDAAEIRDQTRAARLTFSGLQFLVIDPPDPRYSRLSESWIDAGMGQPPTSPCKLPTLEEGSFLCWLFVSGWNGFIRIAAHDVMIEWIGYETADRD